MHPLGPMDRLSLYTVLEQHAANQPDAEAIVIGDVKITYDEFLGRVTALARWLLHHGFVPGGMTELTIRDEVGI